MLRKGVTAAANAVAKPAVTQRAVAKRAVRNGSASTNGSVKNGSVKNGAVKNGFGAGSTWKPLGIGVVGAAVLVGGAALISGGMDHVDRVNHQNKVLAAQDKTLSELHQEVHKAQVDARKNGCNTAAGAQIANKLSALSSLANKDVEKEVPAFQSLPFEVRQRIAAGGSIEGTHSERTKRAAAAANLCDQTLRAMNSLPRTDDNGRVDIVVEFFKCKTAVEAI